MAIYHLHVKVIGRKSGSSAVRSLDGMTADWAHLPYEFLAEVSNKIINAMPTAMPTRRT